MRTLLTPVASREAIVTEARSWLGTPYHHGASLKGVGVDCIGLLIGIARNVGMLPPDWQPAPYPAQWHLHQAEERLMEGIAAAGCVEVSVAQRQPADILLFRFGQVCAHTALLLPEDYMLHALLDRAVVCHRLAGRWEKRLARVFQWPGGDA